MKHMEVKNMNVAYVRVSTIDQNEDRQIKGIEGKFKIDKWFTEKVSGKNTERKELQSMIDYVREGDTVIIKDFSRLARSTKDLLELVELLNNKGVVLISLKENIDSGTPTGKLMLTMIGAINEFERTNLLERQREGIEIAKAKGKYKGRKKKEITIELKELYMLWKNRSITQTEIMDRTNMSRTTLHRRFKELEQSL